jgi:hypothetical protein
MKMNEHYQIIKDLDGAKGFHDDLYLCENDLSNLRCLVQEHFEMQLTSHFPLLKKKIKGTKINQYHRLLNDNTCIDHSFLSPKKNRILPPNLAKKFKNLDFFKSLEKELGPIKISNEDGVYNEEIYWRLTRPEHHDVGPMHADKWFWDLGHGNSDEKYRRIKIWIPIYNEPGSNGLRYVYGSHLKDWPYHGEERDGFIKPMIDITDDKLDITKFFNMPGQAFIFNDRLLHGGFSGGKNSRVSIECTLLLRI